jgi:DNA replication protein
MPLFAGFPDGKVRLTPLPSAFFTELLPQIDHLGELKVTLYAFWFLFQQEGHIRYITFQDFLDDKQLMLGMGKVAREVLADSLERAVQRGTFLKVLPAGDSNNEAYYFLNTARGRAIVRGIQQGDFQFDPHAHKTVQLEYERPNIYRLYEENIGPLTPLMSDTLRDAESLYSMDWIEDAIKIAVQKNARNWRFIDAVLRSWQVKGRYETNKPDAEENRRKYIEGEYADFIEH